MVNHPILPGTYKLIRDHNTVKKQQDVNSSNEFLDDLNSMKPAGTLYDNLNVSSWGDYNRLFYHPRSLHSLPSTGMDLYAGGIVAASTLDFVDQIMEEDFRFFLEECDHLHVRLPI
jgi:hypothetical protein